MRALLFACARLGQLLLCRLIGIVVGAALGADAGRLGGLVKLALRLQTTGVGRAVFCLGDIRRALQPHHLLLALHQLPAFSLQFLGLAQKFGQPARQRALLGASVLELRAPALQLRRLAFERVDAAILKVLLLLKIVIRAQQLVRRRPVIFYLEQHVKLLLAVGGGQQEIGGKGTLGYADGIVEDGAQIQVALDAQMLAQKSDDVDPLLDDAILHFGVEDKPVG